MAVAPAPKGLIRAQPTFMCANKGETIFLTVEKYDEVIAEPTPDTMWYTPRTGWPKKAKDLGNRCRNLIPTVKEDPKLIAGLEQNSVGTLHLEVLQAKGLKKFDAISENDMYALVVFEGIAAVTATIQDMDDPRWHSGTARAFRLPVFNPYCRRRAVRVSASPYSARSADYACAPLLPSCGSGRLRGPTG